MLETDDVQQPSSPVDRDKVPSRVVVSEQEMGTMTPIEWQTRWRQQDSYVTLLERKTAQQEGTISVINRKKVS